jgi:hypothetical protein
MPVPTQVAMLAEPSRQEKEGSAARALLAARPAQRLEFQARRALAMAVPVEELGLPRRAEKREQTGGKPAARQKVAGGRE